MDSHVRVDASVTLDTFVAARRPEIEEALDRRLPRPPLCTPIIAEAMRYGVMSRGKRFRPLLTLAAAETIAASRGDETEAALHDARHLAMPAACAVEFIHCYSLVHDDLPAMDNDSLRRGRPTMHVVYGEALAILVGDGLLAEAFAILAGEPDDRCRPQLAGRKLRALQCIGASLGPGGMLGGQAMDLTLAGRVPARPDGPLAAMGGIDERTLRDMHARKTGALIRAAACAGAIMAGGNPRQVAAIDDFAGELGLAFQIVDDILDVEGSDDVIGKTAGKDRAAGKPTYPAMFGLQGSRALALACIDRARQSLQRSSVPDGRLMPLADWALERLH